MGTTDGAAGHDEQLALVRAAVRRPPPARRATEPSATRPIAVVAVDVPLAHLDRPFDYRVPATLDETAAPGVRVRVRFAGRLVDGFILDRKDESDHEGRLAALERVVSPEPVLTPDVAAVARLIADRYAGTLADVLRLAIPPRHARTEARPSGDPPSPPAPPQHPGPFAHYEAGAEFLTALAGGRAPRAVWTALPDAGAPDGWPAAFAVAARTTLAAGRGVLLVVPDARDAARLDAALTAELGDGHHVALAADLGPAERYRRWLAVRRGAVRAVVGTRAAVFAPVADLGLLALWDDGDDLHAEPRAPYPHAREVLTARAHAARAALLVGGHACTAEGALLVESGWAGPLVAGRETVRRHAPLVRTVGDAWERERDTAAGAARLPSLAWRAARDALATGPVLVQVPRTGYVPGLACERCRTRAVCAHCAGPLALSSGHAVAACGWCGRPAGGWRCPECGHGRFRARAVGSGRTAEELGRAFAGVPLRVSGGDTVLDGVPAEPALVVATPGAEPVAEGGYAAALLLDGWLLLARADLRAAEEALRRWLAAAALVRPAHEGGVVVVMGEPSAPPVQALVRWDPAGHARRELAERGELGYPPAARVAAVTGTPDAVRDLLEVVRLPDGARVLGPTPAGPREDDGHRALIRAPRALGAELASALRAAQGIRSARKTPDHARVTIDPATLG